VEIQNCSSIIFPLAPAEAKRLIAKAVAAMPVIQKAFAEGLIVIANGTTNALVVEELLGIPCPQIKYAAGVVTGAWLGETSMRARHLPVVIERGEAVPLEVREGQVYDARTDEALVSPLGDFVARFKAGDVFVKGANAVDTERNVGVLMGHDLGGSMGFTMGAIAARGCHLVVPVGLEKLVESVPLAAKWCGQLRTTYALGSPVGMFTVSDASVVTEIEALQLLLGVESRLVASGGVLGGEGSTVFVSRGTDSQIKKLMHVLCEIKGEPPAEMEIEVTPARMRMPEEWGRCVSLKEEAIVSE